MVVAGGPAAHDTLNTAELLESILSHLPPTALATARLVSHVFKNNIDASPTLQKIMFNNDSLWETRLEWSKPSAPIHHIVYPTFREDNKHKMSLRSTHPAGLLGPPKIEVKLHPFLLHVNNWNENSRFYEDENFTFRFWEQKLAAFEDIGLWREQYITQPPVDSVWLHCTFYERK